MTGSYRLTGAVVVTIVALTLSLLDAQVFRARADVVTLDVIVKDGADVVRGLGHGDFQVLDRGVGQTIQSVESTTNLSLAVAVDVSASVQFGRVEFRRQVQPGAMNLVHLLRSAQHIVGASAPGDEVSLLAFASHAIPLATLVAADQADRVLADPRWHPVSHQVRSAVWDAVLAGTAVASRGRGRPVVWLLSDGIDNASWLTRQDVQRTLETTGVAVDMVLAPQTYDTLDRASPGYEDPAILSTRSGGRVYDLRSRSIDVDLKMRMADLRAGYRLTFVPTGVPIGDGWHEVTVRVPGRRVSVQVRPGYFSANTVAAPPTLVACPVC